MESSERVLEFEVKRQRIVKKSDCDFSGIVAGTAGYLKAKFYFSPDDWGGCRKAASFWNDGQEYAKLLDDNDMCVIPGEALTNRKFKVSVTGKKVGYQIVTNKATVRQEVG